MRGHIDWTGPIRLDPSLLVANRRFSVGMFASQAASALVYQGDRILVSAVGSPAMAGANARYANVANKMLAAVVALTSFAFPRAAGLHAATMEPPNSRRSSAFSGSPSRFPHSPCRSAACSRGTGSPGSPHASPG